MSETTPPTNPPTTPPDGPPAQDVIDWKAKFEESQAQSRKHEDRAKANAAAAKELETVRQSSMSDIEKAVAVAKTEARTEALREANGRLVAAEVRAALAGRPIDSAALLEGVDPSRFLTADGEVDGKAITAWVDRIAPVSEQTSTTGRPVDLGQGARGRQNEALDSDPLIRDIKAKLGI